MMKNAFPEAGIFKAAAAKVGFLEGTIGDIASQKARFLHIQFTEVTLNQLALEEVEIKAQLPALVKRDSQYLAMGKFTGVKGGFCYEGIAEITFEKLATVPLRLLHISPGKIEIL